MCKFFQVIHPKILSLYRVQYQFVHYFPNHSMKNDSSGYNYDGICNSQNNSNISNEQSCSNEQ